MSGLVSAPFAFAAGISGEASVGRVGAELLGAKWEPGEWSPTPRLRGENEHFDRSPEADCLPHPAGEQPPWKPADLVWC